MLNRGANIARSILAAAAVIALACAVALCGGCGQKAQPAQPDNGQQQAQQVDGNDVDDGSQSGGGSGDNVAPDPEPDPAPTPESNPASDPEPDPASVPDPEPERATSSRAPTIDENGSYTSKDEVALYIHTYGHLPSNFISKTKARNAGWVSSEGNLDEVCPGKSIGGSRFYNDEGVLPDARGRTWTECDIDYHGGYRGEKRIVFSNDGLIFYTEDHYRTFEQLY